MESPSFDGEAAASFATAFAGILLLYWSDGIDGCAFVGAVISRSTITGRTSIDGAAIRERDTTRVNEVRAVFRSIAVDYDRVPNPEITLLPPATAERTRTSTFTAPVCGYAFGVGDIDVEVGVWIGPLDTGDLANEPHWLIPVELGGEGMVGVCR